MVSLLGVNAVLLDYLNVNFNGPWRWGVPVIEALLLVVAGRLRLLRWPRLARDRWAWAEAGTLLFVISLSWLSLLRLAGPDLLPLGTSPDGVYHYQLTDHLRQTGSFKVYDARLGWMERYPPGFHLATGALATMLSRDPIYVLYPMAALALALIVGGAALLAMRTIPAGPWRIVVGLGTALVYASIPPRLTTEQMVLDQYYPTLLGFAVALAAVHAASGLARRPSRAGLLWTALLLAGTLITYIFWLPWAFVSAALIVLLMGHMPVARRIGYVTFLGGATGLFLWRLSWILTGQTGAAAEGSFGVAPTFYLLLGEGVLVVGLAWWTRHRRITPLLMVAALLALQYAAFRWGLILGERQKLVDKTMYALVVIVAPVIASGIGVAGLALARRLHPRRAAGFTGTLVGATILGCLVVPLGGRSPQLFQALDRDDVALALWTRDNLRAPATEVDYLYPYNISAYWLKTGLLRGPRGWENTVVLEYPLPSYGYWATDTERRPYALLHDRQVATFNPGTTPLFQSGAGTVLGRATEFSSDAQAKNVLDLRSYTVAERFGSDTVIRTNAVLFDARTQPGLELWLVLTPQTPDEQTPTSTLWQAQLVTEQRGAGWSGGGVRWNPQAGWGEAWQNDTFVRQPMSPIPNGTALSGWIEARIGAEVLARHRIYDVVMGSPQSLKLRDANPNAVLHWERPPEPTTTIAATQPIVWSDHLRLNGASVPNRVVRGSALPLTLDWTTTAPITATYQLLVRLVGADGSEVARWDVVPTDGKYPFWRWDEGETLRDVVDVPVGIEVSPGTYKVLLGVYRLSDFIPLVPRPADEGASDVVLAHLTLQ